MIDMLPNDPQLMNQGNYALVCKAPINDEASLSLHDYKVIGSLNMNSKAGSTIKLTESQNHAFNRLVVYMRYNCTVDKSVKIDVPPPTLTRPVVKAAPTTTKTTTVVAKPKQVAVVKPSTTAKTKTVETKKSAAVTAKADYDPDKDYRIPTYSEMLFVKGLISDAASTGDWTFGGGENYKLYRIVMQYNEENDFKIWNSLP